jgi:hypothetical protein
MTSETMTHRHAEATLSRADIRDILHRSESTSSSMARRIFLMSLTFFRLLDEKKCPRDERTVVYVCN